MVGLEPVGNRRGEVGGAAHRGLTGCTGAQRDDVVGADLVRGDVDPATIDMEVAVAHQLTSLGTRRGEAETVDDVVEAHLKQAEELLAGDALATRRLLVVIAELLLEDAVVAARLLLLAQLQQVLGLLDAAAAMLARGYERRSTAHFSVRQRSPLRKSLTPSRRH